MEVFVYSVKGQHTNFLSKITRCTGSSISRCVGINFKIINLVYNFELEQHICKGILHSHLFNVKNWLLNKHCFCLTENTYMSLLYTELYSIICQWCKCIHLIDICNPWGVLDSESFQYLEKLFPGNLKICFFCTLRGFATTKLWLVCTNNSLYLSKLHMGTFILEP